jgi:hypothetical protein
LVAMNSEEQITIQLGSYSCYVGTHFWNFQDTLKGDGGEEEDDEDSNSSYQLSQLYRRSDVKNGRQVYTPRALIIDKR